ncbi:MAG: hypothetical protein MUQ32_02405 [Chloroflexi bacterium]|nr:hypothetical protein [Chloroflexota bacterium]
MNQVEPSTTRVQAFPMLGLGVAGGKVAGGKVAGAPVVMLGEATDVGVATGVPIEPPQPTADPITRSPITSMRTVLLVRILGPFKDALYGSVSPVARRGPGDRG